MFESVLIANRGEIACRIVRTLRRLGIRSVAVCSEADRGALFTRLADDVIELGPAPARDSYLRGDRILSAAQRSGAEAIHPGYGFLSENAAFAEQCREAGVRFIGPSPRAIAAMGLKDAAKATMERAGVPVVPGYHGQDQALDTLLSAAERIGYPVLIKAVAGGGGKGMRVVERRAEFAAALEGARREAKSAFGDERVLIEKYLTRPRHIEVQVFADSHGQALHLFERDCSLQRRHQKVLEEAPAPGMSPAMRAAMGAAAVRAAQAIGYEGAGTVEFIADVSQGLDAERFYFMEMNTRLQVEHPVTELITGLDLVEWQLRVAAGEPLPLNQEQVALRGHAIEVRLYAEDPEQEFLPQAGELIHLALPRESAHVRVDAGVVSGDRVSVFYDPMIAKLITWGDSREAALAQLRRALSEVQVAGITTNVALLARVAQHPAFLAGEVHTGFFAEHQEKLLAPDGERTRALVLLACVGHLLARARQSAGPAGDPWSPWSDLRGFRVNEAPQELLTLRGGGETFVLQVLHGDEGFTLLFEGHTHRVHAPRLRGEQVSCMLDGRGLQGLWLERAGRMHVFSGTRGALFELGGAAAAALELADDERVIKAPMPGKISAVLVAEGAKVEKGALLVRLEAMKMEHTLKAPGAGVVRELSVLAGQQVEAGSSLLVLGPVEEVVP